MRPLAGFFTAPCEPVAGRFFTPFFAPEAGRGRAFGGASSGGGASEKSDGSRMWSHFEQIAASSGTLSPQEGQFIPRRLSGQRLHPSNAEWWIGRGHFAYLRPMAHVRAVLVLLVASGCALSRSARPGGEVEEIEALEARRVADPRPVAELARQGAQATTRARALLALGRLQDASTVDAVALAQADADPGVRASAAVAAMLLALSWDGLPEAGLKALERALLAAEEREPDAEARLRQLDALARVATPGAVDRLLLRLREAGAVGSRAGLGLGVAQRQKAKLPEAAFDALDSALASADPAVRFGAAYALAVSKDPRARAGLVRALKDAFPDTRAVAAKGLGDVGRDEDLADVGALLRDGPPGPAAEAARALARKAASCAESCPALDALAALDARIDALAKGDVAAAAGPLLAVAQTGLPAAGQGVLERVRERLATLAQAKDARVRGAASKLDCRYAAALDALLQRLEHTPTCGLGKADRGWATAVALQAISQPRAQAPQERAALAASYLRDPDARVRIAALGALGDQAEPRVVEAVRAMIDDPDPVIAAAAAGAAAVLKDAHAVPRILALARRTPSLVDVAPALSDALVQLEAKAAVTDLEAWTSSGEATVRHVGAAALGKLTGAEVRAGARERPSVPQRPAELAGTARLRTTQGDILLRLDHRVAPLAAANFAALARRGYFDGLAFHRVVPGFVAQGGDPRGDGEGGPGYTIPCEASGTRYLRGAVGMALAGKDTGGSQFFLTLSPQPHLEGRYTVFAQVTRGLEVADALLEGDRILGVDLLPP